MTERRRTRQERRADLVFAAHDPFQNIVRLERETWDRHIVLKHPEVDGMERQAKRLIEDPDLISESTRDEDVAMFESHQLRVLVQYETDEFRKGDTFGRVLTIYPNNGKPLSTVGRAILKRQGGDK